MPRRFMLSSCFITEGDSRLDFPLHQQIRKLAADGKHIFGECLLLRCCSCSIIAVETDTKNYHR